MKRALKVLILLFGVLVMLRTSAQDFHVSQYTALPVYQNPAHTGMFSDALFRVNTLMRSQWASVGNKPFVSMCASADKLMGKRFGAGIIILHNDIGNGYQEQQLEFSGAYRITNPGNNDHWLTVGLQAGMMYKGFREDLTFDNQYTGGSFNTDLPNHEQLLRNNKYMPDLNFGFSYSMRNSSAVVNPFADIAVSHVTSPDESFTAQAAHLARRYTANAGCIVKVNEQTSITPAVFGMQQGSSYEYKALLSTRFEFDSQEQVALMAQLQYRMKDAIVAAIGLEYNEFTYRFAYDITTSGLKAYSNSKGAVELGIQFRKFAQRHRKGASVITF